MDGADIGKASPCADDRKRCIRFSPEEKQPRIFFCRVSRLFFITVNLIEDGISVPYHPQHRMDDTQSRIRVDMVMIRQQGADGA